MVDEPHGRSGPGGDSAPPPFDSMANLRALGDIQRRGLEAANLVVGRLISGVDQRGPLFGAEAPRSTVNGDEPSTVPDMTALVDMYTSFMTSLMAAFTGGQGTPARDADRAAPSTVSADPLRLPPTPPGERADGELWLHNRSGAPVAAVRVHCSDLRRHDGGAIVSSAVTFDPDHLDELPDLTSRGIRAAVDVPVETPPGTYRGTVMAANLPDLWLIVELEVVAPP